jgi:hypothetical protein
LPPAQSLADRSLALAHSRSRVVPIAGGDVTESTPLPSGWFPDPHGRYEYRYFNGHSWTADVADEGRRLVDPYGAAPLRRSDKPASGNGFAVAALTCGLVALVFAWMPVLVVVGIALGVLGVVFGIRGRKRARTAGSGHGMALTGLISGSTALALSIVGIVFTVSFVNELVDFMEPGPYEAEVVSCDVGPGAIDVTAAVTNRSDVRRDYTVYGVVNQPDGVPDLVATLTGVAPGATEQATMHRTVRSTSGGDCSVRLVVHGPTPYGLDMDRIDD